MFNPTADDFAKLEKALGKPIDDDARRHLCILVNRYCTRIDAADGNDPANEAKAEVERATTALISKLDRLDPGSVAALNARLEHRVFSRRGLDAANPDGIVKVATVSAALADLRMACRKTEADRSLSPEELAWINDEIERKDRPKRGSKPYLRRHLDPFERLIVELTTWVRAANLPFGISNAGAAKHQSGSEGFLLSPFSAFVAELLALVGEKYRLKSGSGDPGEALQKRIQRARRNARLRYFPLPEDAADEAQTKRGKRFRGPAGTRKPRKHR